jgi:ribonuclease G
MPGLNAAFVDVGSEKDAFLHYLDLGPQIKTLQKFTDLIVSGSPAAKDVSEWELPEDLDKSERLVSFLKPNQNLLVQITKEPISTKGSRVCSELSFAGRYLVLIPFSNKVSISSKIKSAAERNRLKYTIQSILPKNFGVIVRTVAEGKSVVDLDGDLRHLMSKWDSIVPQLPQAKPPKLLLNEQTKTMTILRDLLNKDFNSIVVNDEDIYREIKSYLGSIAKDKVDIVKYHKNGEPIFDVYGVTKQIKSGFGRVIPIKRTGAYLVIEHTEAMHVIDVNSGNRIKSGTAEDNALHVNLEAATEIARQLRLRDMGGIISIDFIDLAKSANRTILYKALQELMVQDKAKHTILPVNKFGVVQITRQRVRATTIIDTEENCPSCNGTGKIKSALLIQEDIENRIEYLINKQLEKRFYLAVHPFIYAFLTKGIFSIQWHWFRRFRQWIRIEPKANFAVMDFKFFNKNNDQIVFGHELS